MLVYHIPIDLDLRSVPDLAAEVLVEANLPLLAAHAGCAGPDAPVLLAASVPSEGTVPAQSTAGGVLLSLPARLAARERLHVVLHLAGAGQTERPERKAVSVLFSQGKESVELGVEGSLFATYRYNTADPELPRPYFHPVIGPTGVPITQDGEVPGQKVRHFHHTGLVLAHQNFTDGNNWQIGPNFSRMRHLAFEEMLSGPVFGRFVERLEWPSARGDRLVFHEVRTVTLPRREPARRVLDVDTTITCGDRPAVWNATPYHLLAIRVPDAMVVDKGGVITSSEGATNQATAGAPAAWLDFSGPLNGQCGVAIFNHPQNPRHPTAWLNFENETVGAAPAYREPLPWEPGQSRRFRYRVYIHTGDVKSGRVAEEYQAYVAAPASRIGPPARLA